MNLRDIEIMAARFRAAIERCSPISLPFCMREFPRGSCGDASYLLGAFLSDLGVGDFTYVFGRRGEGESLCCHAWLEAGGVLVDITANQFSEITEPVIVSTRSAWHKAFRQERIGPANYRIFDHYTVGNYDKAYAAILALMT